jgi:outer membrane immunogenic protein
MMVLPKAMIAVIALGCAVSPAAANEQSWYDSIFNPASTTSWTGVYVGFNAGAGSSYVNGFVPAQTAFYQSGSVIGGNLGYNWQSDIIVVGIEGDADYAKIDGQESFGANCPKISCFGFIQGLSTLRARVGAAWGGFLPYATFGVASARVNAGEFGFGMAAWEPGWTVGAGIEARIAPQWSMKVEYIHVRMNDIFFNAVDNSGQAVLVDVNQHDVNLVRFGFNYMFDLAPLFPKP